MCIYACIHLHLCCLSYLVDVVIFSHIFIIFARCGFILLYFAYPKQLCAKQEENAVLKARAQEPGPPLPGPFCMYICLYTFLYALSHLVDVVIIAYSTSRSNHRGGVESRGGWNLYTEGSTKHIQSNIQIS